MTMETPISFELIWTPVALNMASGPSGSKPRHESADTTSVPKVTLAAFRTGAPGAPGGLPETKNFLAVSGKFLLEFPDNTWNQSFWEWRWRERERARERERESYLREICGTMWFDLDQHLETNLMAVWENLEGTGTIDFPPRLGFDRCRPIRGFPKLCRAVFRVPEGVWDIEITVDGWNPLPPWMFETYIESHKW